MFPQGNYRYLYPTNKKTATVSEQRRKELKTVRNLRVLIQIRLFAKDH